MTTSVSRAPQFITPFKPLTARVKMLTRRLWKPQRATEDGRTMRRILRVPVHIEQSRLVCGGRFPSIAYSREDDLKRSQSLASSAKVVRKSPDRMRILLRSMSPAVTPMAK